MPIHKFFLIIVATFIAAGVAHSQTREEIIDDIQYRVEQIHLDTSLKSVTLQNEEFLDNMTDGGGELTGFYKGKNNSISRIYRSVGISHGVYLTEFYYRKDKLIFVHDKFNSYVYDDSLGAFDYTKLNTTYSGSYFFKDNKIVHQTSVGHSKFENDNTDVEKTLFKDSEESVRLIKSKIKSQK